MSLRPKPHIVGYGARADDAEERLLDGSVSIRSSDLELTDDGHNGNQLVGIRFGEMDIPKGATILTAHIQFSVDEVSEEDTRLIIEGEATGDAQPFRAEVGNISSRPRTHASVRWNPPPWTSVGEAGEAQRTPELAPILQEVIDREDWSRGQALAVLIRGSGRRTAESFDGNRSTAPRLRIFFTE